MKSIELHIHSCINWKLEQSLDTSTRRIREFLTSENSVDVTTLSEIKTKKNKLIFKMNLFK